MVPNSLLGWSTHTLPALYLYYTSEFDRGSLKNNVSHKVAPFRGARPNYGHKFKYILGIARDSQNEAVHRLTYRPRCGADQRNILRERSISPAIVKTKLNTNKLRYQIRE